MQGRASRLYSATSHRRGPRPCLPGQIGDYTFAIEPSPGAGTNRIGQGNGLIDGDDFDLVAPHNGAAIGPANPGIFFLLLRNPDDAAWPGGFNSPGGPGLPPTLVDPINFTEFEVVQSASLTFLDPTGGGRGGGFRGGGGVAQVVRLNIESISSIRTVPPLPTYRIDLTGQVTSFIDGASQANLGTQISIGDPVSISYVYETGAFPTGPVPSSIVEYENIVTSVDATVGSESFTLGPDGRSLFQQIEAGTSGDEFGLFADITGTPIGGFAPETIFFSLRDVDGTVWPGGIPPLEDPIDFSLFDQTLNAFFNYNLSYPLRGGGPSQRGFNFSVDTITTTLVGNDPLCPADFDGDNDVDLGDFGVFGAAFGSMVGDMSFNPAADFDGDGDVALGDFGIFGSQFGNGPAVCTP